MRVLEVKSPDLLHDLAKRGGFGHEMADLLIYIDENCPDIQPKNRPLMAWAWAWYPRYCAGDIEKNLPQNIVALAEFLNVSRPTLYKWFSDPIIDSYVSSVVYSKLQRITISGLDRMYRILERDSEDKDAIAAFRAIADYDNARRGGAGPGVQVNIDQRQQVIGLDEWRDRQRRIHEQAEETITIFDEATD